MPAVDEMLREWGENIRLCREGLGPDGGERLAGEAALSQDALGKLLEPTVSQGTVARWERGRMEPRRHYKRQLANVLQTDVRLLFPMRREIAS